MRVLRNHRVFSLSMLMTLATLPLFTSAELAAQEVNYNFIPGTNFSKYHMYKWITIDRATHPNQILGDEIKQAVGTQLASKGMTPATDLESADLHVGYQIAVDKERQWNAFSEGGVGWGGGMGAETNSTINIGTLVLVS